MHSNGVRGWHRRGCSCLVSLFVALASFANASLAVPKTDDGIKPIYTELIRAVPRENLAQSIRDIASFGSRLSGSEGEAKTLDYVQTRLRALGLKNLTRTTFDVTIPDPSSMGQIKTSHDRTPIFPIWPNLVRTSTTEVTGTVLYGGDGTQEALKGLPVKGSIVMLEYTSGSRWRVAAKLGAAAIVFIEPTFPTRADSEAKFSGVPVDIPRFYLPLNCAEPVLKAAFAHEKASLSCRQDWVVRKSGIVTAEIPGTDPATANEPVVLMAYADAMSVVPAMAPGGEASTNVAAALELARIWTERPHRRPLQIVVTGGHGQGLQGAREWVQGLMNRKAAPILLTLTLDLSSGSRTVGSYGRGWFYEYRDETQTQVTSMSRIFRQHADVLAPLMKVSEPRLVVSDAVNNGDSRSWKNNIPGKFAFDCEPINNAGMNGLTLATVEDSRDRVDTPADTAENVNVSNIQHQVQTITCLLFGALNDTRDKGEPTNYKVPLDPTAPSPMSLVGGFCSVEGSVVLYDPLKSFVPDSKLPGAIATLLGRQKTMMGVRGDLVQQTPGDKAQYRFIGMAPQTSYAITQNTPSLTRIAAFHIEARTGKIDYAPSLGFYGDDSYPIWFVLTTPVRRSPLVVFNCVSVSLYDLVDPQALKALERLKVLDARTGAPPQDFGLFSPGLDQRLNPDIEDTQVLFLTPGQRFVLLGGSGGESTRLILTASERGDETGKGYLAPGGEPQTERDRIALNGRLPDIPLNTTRDIVAINQTRLDRFRKYRIIGGGVEELQNHAIEEIKLAEAAKARLDWPEFDRHSRAAWGFALRAHPVIQNTANDVVNGVVFYLFLLIPFSYFMERIIKGNQLMTKQLGWSIGIFIGSFVLLRLIHPAFEIVTNPLMIFIAFVMGVLSLIVISFILGKFESSMRLVRTEQTGHHDVDIRRSSVAMAAFNLGVSNMRRRKARTVLTTLTLVVMTFIVLSFTSIVQDLSLNEQSSDHEANYGGLLLRSPGLDAMQLATFRQVQNEFGSSAQVVRRAYYYGADIGDVGILTLQRADQAVSVRAMEGLEPEESSVTHPERALLPGGRWFVPGDRHVMILPQPIATELKIGAADVGKAKVNYAGVDYTVVGIVDPGILRSITDLDGDGLMPADFSLSKQYQEQSNSSNQAFRSYLRLDPSTVFIVPAETALELGADIRNVAVAFHDPTQTRKALTNLMPRLRLNLYASVPKPGSNELEVKQFSIFQASKGTGIGLILIQLLIASVFVLNTMVATVYERTKEIGIFSSIGLAPNHIAMLFFAESLVYGILGAVIGYFAAQGTAKFIVATGAFPGLTLNFSSTSAVMSAVIVLGVVLGSTIYPARKASQIAAPAMNEDVFETEPNGDEWDLPLPFSISAAESGPVMMFLCEWLKAFEGYTIGEVVTKDTRVTVLPDDAKGPTYILEATTWLAPYDLGISQNLKLVASPSVVSGVYALDLKINRLAGDPENWPVVNRRFLASVRRQFLTWRTLDKANRTKYADLARQATEPEAA